MIVPTVPIKPKQLGSPEAFDASLLAQFASDGRFRRLAAIHAAARQEPARHIGVSDEEDRVSVQHDGTDAEGHRAQPPRATMDPGGAL